MLLETGAFEDYIALIAGLVNWIYSLEAAAHPPDQGRDNRRFAHRGTLKPYP